MTAPLPPQREAEIRDRIDRLDDDRTFAAATWLASSISAKSVLPPEQTHVVEDVLETKHSVIRASVGVFGDKLHAEFAAHARDDVPALLDEIDRLRGALKDAADQVAERDDEIGKLSARPSRAEVLAEAADAIVAANDRALWATRPGKHWAADLLRHKAAKGATGGAS